MVHNELLPRMSHFIIIAWINRFKISVLNPWYTKIQEMEKSKDLQLLSKRMFCKIFFCCLSCVSNNIIIIIIAISVASSSLNNPVHKLVQEDGHGKLPVLEIFWFLILFLSKERQKYVFCVFRFNMVGSIYYLLLKSELQKVFFLWKNLTKKNHISMLSF